MKIQEAASNQKTWGGKAIQAGFSEKDLPKLMGLMSGGLYKDAYSWIPEIVQNAVDIHIETGTDKKVIIGFDTDTNGAYLYVEDFGTGISLELMNNVVSKFGASTKDHSNNFIGGKGIGITK